MMNINVFLIVLIILFCSACTTQLPGQTSKELDEIHPAAKDDPTISFRNGSDTFTLKSAGIEFLDASRTAAEDRTGDAAKLSAMITWGIVFSDKICDRWFITHDRDFDRTNRIQKFINIVFETIVAGASFGGAHPDVPGYSALGLAGINSSYEILKAQFLASDIPLLQEKVKEGRTALALQMKATMAGEAPYSYAEVHGAILDYHQTCGVTSLKRLVQKSVELSVYEPKEVSSFTTIAEENEMRELRYDLFELAMGRPGRFSDAQITSLFLIYRDPDSAQSQSLISSKAILERAKTNLDVLKTSADDPDKLRIEKFEEKMERAAEILKLNEALEQRQNQIAETEKELEQLQGVDASEMDTNDLASLTSAAQKLQQKLQKLRNSPLRKHSVAARQPILLEAYTR